MVAGMMKILGGLFLTLALLFGCARAIGSGGGGDESSGGGSSGYGGGRKGLQ